MLTSEVIRSSTNRLVRKCFYDYYKSPKKETKHILLDRLFPDERRITSYMSGLQTSLGSFWEKLAVELLDKNNEFEVLENSTLVKPRNLPAKLSTIINEVKEHRQDHGGDFSDFRRRLNAMPTAHHANNDDFTSMQKGKGCDLLFRHIARNKIYIVDVKTVQVNANNGNTFNETLILWLAYYHYRYNHDANNIYPYLVFPYNSADEMNDGAWWNDFGERVSPLTNQEVFVGNEFWQLITGNPGAINPMIEAFDEVANDHLFTVCYQSVFGCRDNDALRQFSLDVKFYRAEEMHNVNLVTGQARSSRHILRWRHGGCEFKSRVNQLIEAENFTCPTCGQAI